MPRRLLLPLLLAAAAGPAHAQTSALQAQVHAGQVFLWWDQATSSERLIYRHDVPIDAVTLPAASLVARVPGTSALNERRTAWEGSGDIYYVLPGGSALGPGQGLAVLTSDEARTSWFAVLETGEAPSPGVNSLAAPVQEIPGPVDLVEQGTAVLSDGRSYLMYVSWHPTNAVTPWEIGFNVAFLPAPADRPGLGLVVRGHGGGGSYFDGFVDLPPGMPSDWAAVNIDDPWDVGEDNLTYYLGARDDHPAGDATPDDVVVLFTRRRVEYQITWIRDHAQNGWIDPARVVQWGRSVGGAMVQRNARRMPGFFAAGFIDHSSIDYSDPTLTSRERFDDLWGPVSMGLPADDGLGTPAYDYLRLASDAAALAGRDDYPILYAEHGRNDVVVGWSSVPSAYAALAAEQHAFWLRWDDSLHGGEGMPQEDEWAILLETLEYRTDRPFLAGRNFSLDEDPGNGDPDDGDLVGYWNGRWRQYPRFHSITSDRAVTVAGLRSQGMEADANVASATIDLTPRRCVGNGLVFQPGESVRFESRDPVSWQLQDLQILTADARGFVEARNVVLTRRPRVFLWIRN